MMLFEWQPFQPLPITKITHDDVLLIPIARAAIAQLGERQTEDLKVPGSIPGLGISSCYCTACSCMLLRFMQLHCSNVAGSTTA